MRQYDRMDSLSPHVNCRGTYRFPVERYAERLVKAAERLQVRDTTITFARTAPKNNTMPRPMPLLPPVTMRCGPVRIQTS